MTLYIHTHTIKICTQELNAKSAKAYQANPYLYKAITLTPEFFAGRTQDELDYLYTQGQEILESISAETFRRIEKK